jgi:hypothetical protein
MFLKFTQGLRNGMLAKRIHTQMCLSSLFNQRRITENKWKNVKNQWNDDEDEQRRAFHEEEQRKNVESIKKEKKQEQQLKCEITGTSKRPGSTDCECNGMCITRKSETHIIHYKGGVGMISKNKI